VTANQEEKYHWVVIFTKGGKPYPYVNRSVAHMTSVVKRFYDEHAVYPYLMCAIVGDEIQKVVIE